MEPAPTVVDVSLHIVNPMSGSTARVIQFQNAAVAAGEAASLQFAHGQQTVQLVLPGGASRLPNANAIVSANTIYLPMLSR